VHVCAYTHAGDFIANLKPKDYFFSSIDECSAEQYQKLIAIGLFATEAQSAAGAPVAARQ
jgi:hypothetical protein